MRWRPWVITAFFFGSLLFNVGLLAVEEVQPPQGEVEVVDEVRDPVKGFTPTAGRRVENFRAFGLNDKLVEATDKQAKKLMKNRKDSYEQLLGEYREDVSALLCNPSDVPSRYAAMAFLVEADGERRKVVSARLTMLERKEWYGDSMVLDVYEKLELADDRHEDATAMGIAAILTMQEAKVVEQKAPWGSGSMLGRWSFDGMVEQFPEVESELVDYFAMMHVFMELAHKPKGICDV